MDKVRQIIGKIEPFERGWFHYICNNYVMRTLQNNKAGQKAYATMGGIDSPTSLVFYPEPVVKRLVSEAVSEVHAQYKEAFDDADSILHQKEQELQALRFEVQKLSRLSSEVDVEKKTKIILRPSNP